MSGFFLTGVEPMTVPDPELEIRGRGGGGMRSPKKLFSALSLV